MKPAVNKYTNAITAIIVGVPLAIYVRYVFLYAINLPRLDDYNAILSFLIEYSNATGSDQKLALLFSQHNEHRILLSRIIYVLYYSICGEVNFRHIIFINAGILLLLYAIIARFIINVLPGRWHLSLIVLSMGVFSLNNYENMNFAMAGIQNLGVILLFVGSMQAYSSRWRAMLPLAVLLHIVCIFSSGNGIVASFFLWLFCITGERRVVAIVSTIVFFVFTPLYYYHYTPAPPVFFTLNPVLFLPYFLEALGAHFNKELGVIAGVLLVVSLLLLKPWNAIVNQSTRRLWFIIAFAIVSLGVMAVYRGKQPLDFAYSSRYFILSHLVAALTFTLYMYRFREKQTIAATAIIFSLMVFVAIRNYNDGHLKFADLSVHTSRVQYDYPNEEYAKKTTAEACLMEIYCIENHRNIFIK